DNERNSKKILEEILIEIKAIKSKLVEKDKVGANISGDQKSHHSQQHQLQVPDDDTHQQESSPKSMVVSDEVLKEDLWLQELTKQKMMLPTPILGFTMKKETKQNLLDANYIILKGNIIISNYTKSELLLDMGEHLGKLHPKCIRVQTKEVIRYRVATYYFEGAPVVDWVSYKIGSTGICLYVGVVLPSQGTSGLCCSMALTKKSVGLIRSKDMMEHYTRDGSFSKMEHKSFQIKENDLSQLRDSKTLGHILVKCGIMTAMAALSLKEDGSGIQVEIDVMAYIPEWKSTKRVNSPGSLNREF
ncbi:unnamed protein product, partial [Allacma fusca]